MSKNRFVWHDLSTTDVYVAATRIWPWSPNGRALLLNGGLRSSEAASRVATRAVSEVASSTNVYFCGQRPLNKAANYSGPFCTASIAAGPARACRPRVARCRCTNGRPVTKRSFRPDRL